MSGYDSKTDIEKNWSYRELLEMIYIEDLQAISQHKEYLKEKEQQEIEGLLSGRNH